VVITATVLQASLDVLRFCFAMTEDERVIANHIWELVIQRHKNQITRLQEILGVSEEFEQKVQDLWNKANNL
jgi:hypothetical protein